MSAGILMFNGIALSQTITNGSFEYDSSPSNGNSNYWTGSNTIASGITGSYLPGWTITRPSNSQVDVFNANSTTSPSNPYSYARNKSVIGGPDTGLRPFDAVDGALYLGMINNNTSSATITTTTASTNITGLISGNSYEVSYWYAGFADANQGVYDIDLVVKLDSVQKNFHDVLYVNNTPATSGPGTGVWMTSATEASPDVYSNWKKGSFTFNATSASSVLDFIGLLQGGPAQLVLDNVGIKSVPEPSAALLGALALGAALLRRRR